MPNPSLIPITEDPSIAGQFAGPRGEVLELHIPLSELAPDPLGPAGTSAKSGGQVLFNPYNTPEREWVVPHQIPEDWIVNRTPGPGGDLGGSDFGGSDFGGSDFGGGGSGGGGWRRGGFLSFPDIDLSPAGDVAGPVGLTFLGTNLISDVLENKPPSQIASETVTNTIMGTAVGSLLTAGGTALGAGIGFLLGGPPGAIAGGQLGGGFVVGALLGIGAMGSGQRLGQDLGAASADAPVKAGPSPATNWADLPPPPFDLGLGLLDPQSWGYPSDSGNMINPWSVFTPGSADDILRRALAAEAQLGQNNGLGTNQTPYWASPQGNTGSGGSLPPNYWNRGANNPYTPQGQSQLQRQMQLQRQSQMQGLSQSQGRQSQSSMPGLQQVTPPPPLQPVPAFTPVQAPKPLQVQAPPPLPGAISSQPAQPQPRRAAAEGADQPCTAFLLP